MDNDNKTIDNQSYYERAVMTSLRIAFVAMLFVVSFLIVKPFIVIVLWGIIIAVGVYPLFQKLAKMLGNKEKLSSTILTLSGLILIVVPSYLLFESAIEGVQSMAEQYEAGTLEVPPPPESVAEWPVVGAPLYEAWKLASTNLDAALKTLGPQLKEYVPALVGTVTSLGGTVFLTIISIIIAGVLLLKAEAAEAATKKIFKLFVGSIGDEFTELSVSTIRSVAQGVLGVAIIQSVAAGILMLIFDIPMAGLWAIIVLFLAIIQLPPTLIMLPVGIYGFTIMDTTAAVIFLILAILVSISDTFLKPILLGRGVELPMLVILLGAIGGMILMGIMGLFLGAIILALSYKVFVFLMEYETK